MADFLEDKETIVIHSSELPEIAAWQNNQMYDVTKTYKAAKQIRRTEFADGTFAVELEVNPPSFTGELNV